MDPSIPGAGTGRRMENEMMGSTDIRKSRSYGGGGLCRLAQMCVEAACESKESVQAWRRQRRTLERLPVHLAQPLFHRLLQARLLNAPLLELFQHSVEEVNVCGEAAVDAEWTAYLSAFRYLRVLEAADCRSISDFALLPLTGLKNLEELDVSRCAKVTDEGVGHLLSFAGLRKLWISETGITAKGLNRLSALKSLTCLDLGGLPIDDSTLSSLLILNQLQHLDLWGSRVSDEGALLLQGLPQLQYVNLAWTSVTQVPPLLSLRQLNMSKCAVFSIFEGWERLETPLQELHLSGSEVLDPFRAFAGPGTKNVSILDLSASRMTNFSFFGGMKKLAVLDLSGTAVPELAMHTVADVGGKLKRLDLSGAKVGSEGVGVLAGCVPKLEQLSLSGTMVDDSVFSFLGLMPALQSIDLSHTIVKGFYYVPGMSMKSSSFAAIEHLHALRMLNLRNTFISNKSCRRLTCLTQLTHVYLRSDLLSDSSLQFLSPLKKLIVLSIEGAVLTDSGLLGFSPPPLLKELNLTDCWLLTENGIFKFYERNPGLLVRHELIPGGSEHCFGSVNGLRAKSLKHKKGTIKPEGSKPKKLQFPFKTSEYLGSSKPWASEGSSDGRLARRLDAHFWDYQKDRKVPMVSIDERIRYTKTDLLNLRLSPLSNVQYAVLDFSKIPTPLLNTERKLM